MSAAAGGTRPLAGRRVLVTRPRAQADAVVQQLESEGATAVIAPTIRVVPPDDSGPLSRAAADMSQFDWVVFASANAVDALVSAATEAAERLDARVPARAHWPRSLKIAAVGSRTAERLQCHGVEATVVPEEFRAEALVAALTIHGPLSGTRVLLPRSDIGRDTIVAGLQGAGAIVTDVIAYRTMAESPGGDSPAVREMLDRGDLDAVTFTSGSAVRQFVQWYGPESAALLAKTVVAVIGPVTGDVARELGVPVHVQPTTYTTAAMVAALADHFGGDVENEEHAKIDAEPQ